MSSALDFSVLLPGNERGPIDADKLAQVIATVQDRLDLVTVLRVRYGARLEVSGARWRTACFLPSLVLGFEGACADQDALSEGGVAPQNLWVSEGDTTRVWRCFSCGRRGDVIDLLEAADGLKRSPGQIVGLSAIRVAAKLVGVSYLLDGRAPGDGDDPSDLVSKSAPRRIVAPRKVVDFKRARSINAFAAKHWRSMLACGPGYMARDELKRRGVTSEQIERYVLGYAPAKWRELVELIPEHARAEAETLGIIGKTRQGEYYDRYRARLIFPYCEPARDGRAQAVTGFAGRDLSEETTGPRSPKWFNSRNVEGVWKKSGALLGLLQAKTTLERTKCKRVAVGEGGWEVLAFDRIDVACVGLVAAPMSLDHARLIADVLGAEQVTIAGDGDESGRRGVFASAISLLRYGFPVSAVTVIDPEDDADPGQWGETEAGTQLLRDAWARPQALVDFVEAREADAREQQKRALIGVLPADLAARLADRWGLPFDSALADEESTPAARFVESLKQSPGLALRLDGAIVHAVFEGDSLARCLLRDLKFGEDDQVHELPVPIRSAWLALYLSYLSAQLKAHESTNPFGDGGTHESFKAWYARGEALLASKNRARKDLALCKA